MSLGTIANIAILAGAAGDGSKRERKEIVELMRKIQEPDFSFKELTAPQLEMVGELFPEVYEAVQMREGPALAEDSPEGRRAQLAGLGVLEKTAREGLPLEQRLAAEEAQQTVGQGARRAQQDVLRELAERGRLGGGTEIAARMGASANASEMARGMGSDLARQSVMNQLNAAMQSGQLGGALRQQDISLSGQNANAINRFNEYFSQLGTQAARDAALARNQAQAYNVGTRQDIANQNVFGRYDTQRENLDRRNALEQARFQSALQKAGALSGALSGYGDYKDAQTAARAQALRSAGESSDKAIGSIFGFGGG